MTVGSDFESSILRALDAAPWEETNRDNKVVSHVIEQADELARSAYVEDSSESVARVERLLYAIHHRHGFSNPVQRGVFMAFIVW